MKTSLEKKTQRKISRGSKSGRYVVGRRRRTKARPGRKKGLFSSLPFNTKKQEKETNNKDKITIPKMTKK